MQRRVAILSECYLNACLANLAIKSMEIGERRVQVKHKFIYGGDRIISELKNKLNEFRERYDVIICLIDYERENSPSRRYRESAFPEAREIRQGIKVARSRWQNVYGILFDPNPEAVLDITEAESKRLNSQRDSQRVCETVNKIFERDSRRKRKFEEILEMLSNAISKLVRNGFISTS